MLEVQKQIAIDAPADRVWSILSDQFGSIDRWAARMLTSSGDDSLGELGGRRVTTVEYGPAVETLYVHDDEARRLGYHVEGDSLPGPLSDVKTEWQVDSDGSGSGVILWFEAAVSDESVKPMLEERLESGMLPLLEELKHFSETGEAHPNKLASSAIA